RIVCGGGWYRWGGPTIPGVRAQPRLNGPCPRRRRSISSIPCRGSSVRASTARVLKTQRLKTQALRAQVSKAQVLQAPVNAQVSNAQVSNRGRLPAVFIAAEPHRRSHRQESRTGRGEVGTAVGGPALNLGLTRGRDGRKCPAQFHPSFRASACGGSRRATPRIGARRRGGRARRPAYRSVAPRDREAD